MYNIDIMKLHRLFTVASRRALIGTTGPVLGETPLTMPKGMTRAAIGSEINRKTG
jgi:hypothetical protein